MVTTKEADEFAEALGALCKKHGMMLWTAFAISPMLVTPVPGDTEFFYRVESSDSGRYFVVVRELGRPGKVQL